MIYREEDCVVDAKDPIIGKSLTYSKLIDRYAVKVQPHLAILEQDYFIRLIEKAEKTRDEEIRKMGLGFRSDEQETDCCSEKDPETEWDKLQKLPDSQYLLKTILPVLYQGMTVVDLQRPVAPLEFLALYLLKNQHKIELPPRNTK